MSVAKSGLRGAPVFQLSTQTNPSKDDRVPDGKPTDMWCGRTSTPRSPPIGVAVEQFRSFTPVYKHKIQEAETVVIEPLPHIKEFRYWKIIFYKTIAAASGRGTLGTESRKG